MAGPTAQEIDFDRLRSDLRRCAEIAEVPFNAPAVDRVIAPLADLFTANFWLGMRITTKPANSRDVNLRFGYTEISPIPQLLQAGLITYRGHPIERLAEQITDHLDVAVWGVDASVQGVADKVWLGFAGAVPLADFLALPALPPAVHAARPHFDRAAMNGIGMVALDFTSQTINLYGQGVRPGTFTTEQVTETLTGLNFPLPADEEIARNTEAFNFYTTFRWDSPDLLRVSYPIMYGAADFPTHYHPLLKAFVEQAPVLNEAVRDFGFYATYGPRGGYYKAQSDYTGNHRAFYPHHYSSAAPRH